MIHSHWLCYKYFYGSVFLFLFPSSFFQKAWVVEHCFQDSHNCTQNHRTSELEESLEFAQVLSPAFYRWGNWSPEWLRDFVAVTESGPGRLWVGPPGLLNPRAECIPPHLAIFQCRQGKHPGAFPTIRPWPQSGIEPGDLKIFSSQSSLVFVIITLMRRYF